jgi:hypothetical protein
MILLDYIPNTLLAHHKLTYLEGIDKLRGLFESAEKSYKIKKFVEGIGSLTAALDLTLQLTAEKKKVEISGNTTEDIVNDAEEKKLLNKRVITQAKKILTMSVDITNGNPPTEQDFLAVIANFRKDSQ